MNMYLLKYGGDEGDCLVVEAKSVEQAAQDFLRGHDADEVTVWPLPPPVQFRRVVRIEAVSNG